MTTINIDDLTLGQIKQIKQLQAAPHQTTDSAETAFKIGTSYFIRTATYHVTGKLVAVYPQELVLKDAAWIADSGRFSAALASGNFSEVEPFHNPAIINRGGIIDATILDTPLPREVK